MKNRKLVMIPGPSPVARSIQDQMGRDTVAFKDPDFVKDFQELVKDLKEMFKASGECFVVAGTGTLAMEMAIANTTKREDNVLVISNGYFGDRFTEMCKRKGLNVDVLSSQWGDAVKLDSIKEQLSKKKYSVVTVTHVDTSTGVKADVKSIGEVVSSYDDTLLIVDGVCATSGEEEYLEEMNIDVLLTGSQKAFGVAPGLLMLWASQKAIHRRETLGDIPESYVDFKKWTPIMHDPSKYWGTPAVNLIWALKESVRLIKEEGLDNRIKRHELVGKSLQAAVEALGFGILAKEEHRASTLTNFIYPNENIDDGEFRKILAEEGVVVAGALGAYAGKAFRLGHMGHIDMHHIVSTISGIERALYRVGYDIEFGLGNKVFFENYYGIS